MSSALRTFASTSSLPFYAAIAALVVGVGCGGSDGAAIPSTDTGNGSGSTRAPGTSSSGGGDGASSSSGSSGGTLAPSNDDAGTEAPSTGNDAGSTPPASSDAGTGAGATDGGAATSAGLDPGVAPGGNFDLSIWQLQEPVGSPGSPTTFSPSQLEGAKGHADKYFYTDTTDGSMVFWDPEDGVTTANSDYPRSELREMTASGAAANWLPPGTHRLSATLKATVIPDHVAVGQIHLGTGTPASTKPLLELFYYASGKIAMAIEQTPAGGNEVATTVGTVPVGTKWSYVIGLSGNTITLSINGGATQTFAMSSTFDQEGMYFKAGNYDQSVGTDTSISSQVQFYALKVVHGQ